MISELDTVVLLHDLEEYGLKEGDVGAVVHVYRNDAAYEVEFVTGEGETVALVTLRPSDIRLMGQKEILHARELAPAV
jgi:hypothetical protein